MSVAVELPRVGAVAAFRSALRHLIAQGIHPGAVDWRREGSATTPDLFAAAPLTAGAQAPAIPLPRDLARELEAALHHSDPARFALAHAAVARLRAGRLVWADRSDPTVARLTAMAQAVRRDLHKMHAFVRFRELVAEGTRRRFAAWFEPAHHILEPAAPFFARRFGDMDWLIATPDLTARFIGGTIAIAPSDSARPPDQDAAEDLWRTYYASIFNPARIKIRAMQSEMPRKYWRNMPETALIPEMLRDAPARVAAMQALAPTLAAPARLTPRLAALARAREAAATGPLDLAAQAAGCTRCELHRHATATVWGEGPADARIMLVGEQPGDAEDLAGRPFVGPSGAVLDAALAEAGLDRAALYLTNAVKHFRFQPRGKLRLHKRPDMGHIEHCRWWLDLERARQRPRVIVALGQTAATALSVPADESRRGTVLDLPDGTTCLVSWHPAHILRAGPGDGAARQAELAADLAHAARLAAADAAA